MGNFIEQFGHVLWVNQDMTEHIVKGDKFILYGKNGMHILGETLQETKEILKELGRDEILPDLPEE